MGASFSAIMDRNRTRRLDVFAQGCSFPYAREWQDMHDAANDWIGSQSLSSHFRGFPTKADLSAQ